MKKQVIIYIMVGLVIFTTQITHAATEAQKRTAINAGLKWLAQQQQPDGRWQHGYYPYCDPGVTGMVLQCFLRKGYTAGSDVVIDGTNYGDVIGDGLNYIFSMARVTAISMQPAGDPDINGNGIGIYFSYSNGYTNYYAFNSGMVIPAIVLTGTPSQVITTGSQAGRTYYDVVQDAIDYLAWGQTDSGSYRGGWRYTPNYGSSDQEFTPWVALGMLTAETNWGIIIPPFVRSELQYWMNFIQYSGDGGAGYTDPGSFRNEAHTAGLLTDMTFFGPPYDLTHTKVQMAMSFLNNYWTRGIIDVYSGNFGHPYGMWRCYIGLGAMIGLDDTTYITNLRGCGSLDPGHFANWHEDYCQYLVTNQQAAGYWYDPIGGYWGNILSTAWYADILKADQLKPKITGYVLKAEGGGLEGVVVTAKDGEGTEDSDTTIATGYYELEVSYDWSGTVTLDKAGWWFNPANRLYGSLTTDQSVQNFTAYVPGADFSWNITQLSTSGDNDCARVSGAGIVWRNYDNVDGDYEVFYHSGTTTQVTNNTAHDHSPDISGSTVIWAGNDGASGYDGDTEIKIWSGVGITTLTDNGYSDNDPRISGTNIVWKAWPPSGNCLQMYTGGEIITIPDSANADAYRIDGGRVVWHHWDGTDTEIYYYNGSSTLQLTLNSGNDFDPVINGDKIVWYGDSDGDNEIYLYDISAGGSPTQITNNSTSDILPDISGNYIVWEGSDGSDAEIFYYNLLDCSIHRITDNTYQDNYPKVSGSLIVWEGYTDDSQPEIFVYNILTQHTTQLTNNGLWNRYPEISGTTIAWTCENQIFKAEATAPVKLDFEDIPGSGFAWMPPWSPYHDITSMGSLFTAYQVGSEAWVRSMSDANGNQGEWSVVNWGGGYSTRSIVFRGEVDFKGAWFTRGQTWYAGSYVAAKWVQITGKDKNNNVVGTTEKMYFVDVDGNGNFIGYGDENYYNTYRYLKADMNGVKRLEITSFNNEYNTAYYQMDNLEYSLVPPALSVLEPNGGEILVAGKTYTIRWDNEGIITNVLIEYSTNNGEDWTAVTPPNNGNSGSYNWLVPSVPSAQCLVRVTDVNVPAVSDTGNSVFTIEVWSLTLTEPNAGEVLPAGRTYTIKWESDGNISDVRIEYSTDNGAGWKDVYPPNTGNTGTYDWLVPKITSNQCLLRITDLSGSTASDTSGIFNIYTVGAAEDLYVSWYGSSNVVQYDDANGIVVGPFVSSVTGPYDVEFGSNGNMFVASYSQNSIFEYDGAAGTLIRTFVAAGYGGLSGVRDMAFGPNGNLFVLSKNNNSVIEYDGSTGVLVQSFALVNANDPRALAFSSDGSLFVASYRSHAVLEYNGFSGAFVRTVVTGGLLKYPEDLEFGPDGALYIASWSTRSVLRYDNSTGQLTTFIPTASGGLSCPEELQFGPDGKLYVADWYNHQVKRYNASDGNYIDTFVNGSGTFGYPSGLAFKPADTAVFQGLGFLEGGDNSQAWSVSADGSVVVGRSNSSASDEAFRWTETNGMQSLAAGTYAHTWGASANGSVVVGINYDEYKAFRWTVSSGMEYLMDEPGQACGVSADGMIVVGADYNTGNAFRWIDPNGIEYLTSNGGQAWDVSADGTVVVGADYDTGEAFRWTESGGIEYPTNGGGQALAVSADGTVVVGSAWGSGDERAFRWTSATAAISLGTLPGGYYSIARAVSADGSIVVGMSQTEEDEEAFIWDVDNGIRNLSDVLEKDFRLDLTGWTLHEATGISDDGLTIVGYGTDPCGSIQGWVVNISPYVKTKITRTLRVGPGEAYATIQSAIDDANAGDTLIVAAGTYNENITIPIGKTSLTLLGANAGLPYDDPDRGDETIIDCGVGISADKVTLDGFKIKGGGVLSGGKEAAVYLTANTKGADITNNILAGNYPAGEGGPLHASKDSPGVRLGNNVTEARVQNTKIGNWKQGAYINPSSDISFDRNHIHECNVGIESYGLSNTKFLYNTFIDNFGEAWSSHNGGDDVRAHWNSFICNKISIHNHGGPLIQAWRNWWSSVYCPGNNGNEGDVNDGSPLDDDHTNMSKFDIEPVVCPDGDVDFEDLRVFVSHWLQTSCSCCNNWCGKTDFNKEDGVNFVDFAMLSEYWLQTAD